MQPWEGYAKTRDATELALKQRHYTRELGLRDQTVLSLLLLVRARELLALTPPPGRPGAPAGRHEQPPNPAAVGGTWPSADGRSNHTLPVVQRRRTALLTHRPTHLTATRLQRMSLAEAVCIVVTTGNGASGSSTAHTGPAVNQRIPSARMQTAEITKRRDTMRRTMQGLEQAMKSLERCDTELFNLIAGGRDSVGGRIEANAPVIAQWRQRRTRLAREVEQQRDRTAQQREQLINQGAYSAQRDPAAPPTTGPRLPTAPATGPLKAGCLVGRHVLMPRSFYPDYPCETYDGRGWAAQVTVESRGVATIKCDGWRVAHFDVAVVLAWPPLESV